METVEIETAVYTAMVENADFLAMLPKGAASVFHLQAPSDKRERYPIVVYSVLSDVPVISGDDVEITHAVTMRVHIVTNDGQYSDLYRAVNGIMTGQGFRRIQTTPYVEDGKKILIADYRIGVNAEWRP